MVGKMDSIMAELETAKHVKPRSSSFGPGNWLFETLNFVGECVVLVGDVLKRLLTRPQEIAETLHQMAFVGVNSIPVVVLTTLSSGAVIALYTSEVLVEYGASSLAGGAIGLTVIREMAPVLAGIMVAARCGSAMAAQIGSMVVSEQIDALRSLNVHPTNYLIIPRLTACFFMVPILSLMGMYAGVLGGYAVAVFLSGVPEGTFWNSIQQFVTPQDIFNGMLKALVFGVIVSVVACQQGMQTTGGAVGIGKSTTRTVVISMALIYVADFFLTKILFG